MKTINNFITERQMGGEWKNEKNDKFKCVFLAFEDPSTYGIDNGRISKLWIGDLKTKKMVANYDRGWDEPVDKNNKELVKFYNEILKKYN